MQHDVRGVGASVRPVASAIVNVQRWAAAALVLNAVALATAFGVRTWRHRRATGSTGFHGVSGRPGSPAWWGGVLFPAALVVDVVGLVAVATDPDAALAWMVRPAVAVAGLVLGVAGLVVVLAAQNQMGSSWRIGVDDADRTALVADGLFARVRNPVFTGMVMVVLGAALMAPTALTIASFCGLVAAVQIQVRVVEEPHLALVHGERYAAYTARVGRFLPGVGRARPTTTETRGT